MGLRSEICFVITLCVTTVYSGSPYITPASPNGTYTLNQGENMTLYCSGKDSLTWTKQTPLSQDNEGGFTYTMRKEQRTDGEYVALDLINVNEHTVGFYACHTTETFVDLNNLKDVPKPTNDVDYVYIFVNGTSSSLADLMTFIIAVENTTFVIPCRPTVPDAEIELLDLSTDKILSSDRYTYDQKIGFILDDPEASDTYICISKHNVTVTIHIESVEDCSKPAITIEKLYQNEWNTKMRAVDESLRLSCTINRTAYLSKLTWVTPSKGGVIEDIYNQSHVTSKLSISKLKKRDSGVYSCHHKCSGLNNSAAGVNIRVFDAPFLAPSIVRGDTVQSMHEGDTNCPSWKIIVHGYPGPYFTIWRNNEEEIYPQRHVNNKYTVKISTMEPSFEFKINNCRKEDSGNYTVKLTNGITTNDLILAATIFADATVSMAANPDKRYLQGTKQSFACNVTGNPLPETTWTFEPECQNACDVTVFKETTRKSETPFAFTSIFEMQLSASGNLACQASNNHTRDDIPKSTIPVLLYEAEDGFEIIGQSWLPREHNMELKCIVSKYDYTDLRWYKSSGSELTNVSGAITLSNNLLSNIATLTVENASFEDGGVYVCEATRKNDSTTEQRSKTVTVKEWAKPTFLNPLLENGDRMAKENLGLELNCTATGVPLPTIRWFYEGTEIPSTVVEDNDNGTVESVLNLTSVTRENLGEYMCVIKSEEEFGEHSRFVNLILENYGVNKTIYLSIIGIICLTSVIMVSYLLWKVRKERRYRMKLYNQFNNGNTRAIDPDLALDEQADKLPYNKRFEFPQERLIMSNVQLGKGAFGEVYRAEARGIIDAEQVTTVAVKKVKPDADRMYLDALISELKILIHMGRNLNVVNLLGACTKKIAERELMVILEYCRFGNLHKYIHSHRRSFIDQLTDSRNHQENGMCNRGYFNSTDQSIGYSETDHTPVTGRTTLHSEGECPVRTVTGESDYVEMKWRSNYNYRDGSELQRRLCTADLVCWAYQIACGMNYLATRKILHGDLAARNVLLTDNNVVKICDFGLARNIQNNNEYTKQSNDPVPVKWLALECLIRRVFSTQSDVWSFGVVMWELFSLACTPYPGIGTQQLIEMLEKGERLEKPKYANEPLYEIMRACWDTKPVMRPSFAQLQRQLGDMLEQNQLEHYSKLNAPYLEMNEKWLNAEGTKDYLALIMAPTYKNGDDTPTASPGSLNGDLPRESELDEYGYLQVNRPNLAVGYVQPSVGIFNFSQPAPRASDLSSEPAARAERAPMLPRSHNIYVNTAPDSIAEEEEVGDAKAVGNPMYLDLPETQTAHSYANIKV